VEKYIKPAIDLIIPERARLANIFRYQPENLSDKELTKLRIKVMDLGVTLCGKRKTVKHKRL
jgi:hypothetical protein